MKDLKKIIKSTSKKDFLDLIISILNCPSHFHKPTIKNNDKDFYFGDKATVVCEQCVNRMREMLGLDLNEDPPSNFSFFHRKRK